MILIRTLWTLPTLTCHPGDEAECLYVVISGRLRLVHEAKHPVTGQLHLITEEEVGRGEAVGAVWTISGLESVLCDEPSIRGFHPILKHLHLPRFLITYAGILYAVKM